MVEQLEPEKAPGDIVIQTLRKLERPNWALVAVNTHYGVLLGFNRPSLFGVEKIPMKRILHLVERGYVIEAPTTSVFAQLGWIEYLLTYEGTMLIRDHHR